MPSSVTVTINRPALDRTTRDPNGDLGRWLEQRMNAAGNVARSLARVDTGLMRSRIESTVEGPPLVGVLRARTDYSAYVEARYPFLLPAVEQTFG